MVVSQEKVGCNAPVGDFQMVLDKTGKTHRYHIDFFSGPRCGDRVSQPKGYWICESCASKKMLIW